VPPRQWTFRVQHILDAIRRIGTYTSGLAEDAFAKDVMRIDAVVRNFAVIGEAAALIPEEVRSRYAEVPWRSMRAMRNVLVHDYQRVDVPTVWQTVQQDLPPLIPLLERILAEN